MVSGSGQGKTPGPASRRSRKGCWITNFIEATNGITTHRLFQEWSALSALSGIVERRIYVQGGAGPVYPNIFVLLAAAPGIGKSTVVKQVNSVWGKIQEVHRGPDSITKASLIDTLAEGLRSKVIDGDWLYYNAVSIGAHEFNTVFPVHELVLFSTLANLWDGTLYLERTRLHGKIQIDAPYITLLAGVQPHTLFSIIPDEAWYQGFMSRCFVPYVKEGRRSRFFAPVGNTGNNLEVGLRRLASEASSMLDRGGNFNPTPDAEDLFENISYEMGRDFPNRRLEAFRSRYGIMLAKIAMLYAYSVGHSTIMLDDVECAHSIIAETELTTIDLIREYSYGNRTQLKEYSREFIRAMSEKAKPYFLKSEIMEELAQHFSANDLPRVLDFLVESRVLIKTNTPTMEDEQAFRIGVKSNG